MRLKKMDGWTEEGSRKESREEARVVSSLIGYTRLTPEASISAREKEMETLDGDAGRKNKLSSAETGGRVMV